MGDKPAPLGSEEEMGRGSLIPPLKGLSGGEPIEGDVKLHRVEVLAVELQPASLGEIRGIKDSFPVFIAVAAGAEKQPAPRFTSDLPLPQAGEGRSRSALHKSEMRDAAGGRRGWI